MKNFLSLVLLVFTVAACGRPNADSSVSSADTKPLAAVPVEANLEHRSNTPEPTRAVPIARKLIRNGSLSLEVKDVEESRMAADTFIRSVGGYIADESRSDYGNGVSVSLQIRVPAERFDTLIVLFESVARRIENKSITVSDVTEEFVDVEARIKVKYDLEARYKQILKEARSVSEILEVERELHSVRSDIESMEGRIKFLSDQVAMSTLAVTLSEKATTRSGFWLGIGESFIAGWNGFLGFINAIVLLWPYLVLGVAAYWVFRRWKKRKSAGQ